METIRMATMEAGSGLRAVGVALGAALVAVTVLLASLPAAAELCAATGDHSACGARTADLSDHLRWPLPQIHHRGARR